VADLNELKEATEAIHHSSQNATGRVLRITSAALLAFIIVCGSSAYGQVQTYGDWKVDLSDPSVYAAVAVNDSNQQFGQYCFFDEDSSCDWYFEADAGCTDGSKYHVMANGGFPNALAIRGSSEDLWQNAPTEGLPKNLSPRQRRPHLFNKT
jgi:hypothetical protein